MCTTCHTALVVKQMWIECMHIAPLKRKYKENDINKQAEKAEIEKNNRIFQISRH